MTPCNVCDNLGRLESGQQKKARFPMTIDIKTILDNEGNTADLLQFVERLRKEYQLKHFYIMSVGVWIQYFKNCIKEGTSIQNEYIMGRFNDLSELEKHFSQDEWPELYRTKMQIAKFMRQIKN